MAKCECHKLSNMFAIYLILHKYLIYKIKQAVLFSFWVILPSIYESKVTALWYHVQTTGKKKKKACWLNIALEGRIVIKTNVISLDFWGHIPSLTSVGLCASLDQMCGKNKTMFKLWNENSLYHRGKVLCLALPCAPPWVPAPITQETQRKHVVGAHPPLVLSGKPNPRPCVCPHTVRHSRFLLAIHPVRFNCTCTFYGI